jgi:hypothetical protein
MKSKWTPEMERLARMGKRVRDLDDGPLRGGDFVLDMDGKAPTIAFLFEKDEKLYGVTVGHLVDIEDSVFVFPNREPTATEILPSNTEHLTAFYQKYDPEKVASVQGLIKSHTDPNKEDCLLKDDHFETFFGKLVQEYGPEPPNKWKNIYEMMEIGTVVSKSFSTDSLVFSIDNEISAEILKLTPMSGLFDNTLQLPEANAQPAAPENGMELVVYNAQCRGAAGRVTTCTLSAGVLKVAKTRDIGIMSVDGASLQIYCR